MPVLPRTSVRLLHGIIPPDRHSVPATARRPKYAPHAPTSYPAALPDQPARSRLHRVFHPQKAGYLLSFSMLFASSHCVFFHPPIVHFTALFFSIAQRKTSVWYPFFRKALFCAKMRFLHIFRLQREKITDIVGLTALSHEWHEWRKIHKMHQRNEKHERNT